MTLNLAKTKEIVFHKPNPRNYLPPSKLNNIERVPSNKLLGVIFSQNLKFDNRVTSVISQCSQRMYLLRQLKLQGLCINKLDVVFNALIVSRMCYALQAWGGFILCSMLNPLIPSSKKL